MAVGTIIKIIVILALVAGILFLINRMLSRAAKGGEDHVKAETSKEALDAIQKANDAVVSPSDELRDKFLTD